jgi:hypothetical protein
MMRVSTFVVAGVYCHVGYIFIYSNLYIQNEGKNGIKLISVLLFSSAHGRGT